MRMEDGLTLAGLLAWGQLAFHFMLQNALLLTLLFIFGGALVTALLRSRARDRCLKHFHGYHVNIEETDKRTWGKLEVYSAGLELSYDNPHQDRDGHQEFSSVFFQHDLGNLTAIYRFKADLTEDAQRQRELEVANSWNPTFFPRWSRRGWNVLGIFRDACIEAMGAVVSQMRKSSGSGVIAQQAGRIEGAGKTLIEDAVSHAYEPVLERQIGKRVVVEYRKGDAVEIVGVLREYSELYLELMDVALPKGVSDHGKELDLILPRRISVVRHRAQPL
jgi:hypothetical protein